MSNASETAKDLSLDGIVTTAVKIPGVKVDRNKFLAEMFSTETETLSIQKIIDEGPIAAGATQEQLTKIANQLIIKRTSQSSAASFVAGLPGGLAMAATIPADVLQFFGMALRLAQELSYLYGGDDLWQNGQVDDEQIRTRLIMYCGVMFGVSGAVSGVRVLSTQIAKTTLKKLPQKALTKTFWYPMVKQIGKAIGVKVTKTTVAQGFSKAIPVVGGIISGGLNFASMMPMANRLRDAFDKSTFNYTEEDLNNDLDEIESIADNTDVEESTLDSKVSDAKMKISTGIKSAGNSISETFSKIKSKDKSNSDTNVDVFETIEKLSKLKEMGAISQEEFDTKKTELLASI